MGLVACPSSIPTWCTTVTPSTLPRPQTLDMARWMTWQMCSLGSPSRSPPWEPPRAMAGPAHVAPALQLEITGLLGPLGLRTGTACGATAVLARTHSRRRIVSLAPQLPGTAPRSTLSPLPTAATRLGWGHTHPSTPLGPTGGTAVEGAWFRLPRSTSGPRGQWATWGMSAAAQIARLAVCPTTAPSRVVPSTPQPPRPAGLVGSRPAQLV